MSETKEEIKPVKIRPPIYKFPDSDQTWVQLYELAQILNMRPVDCWETYHSTPYEGRKSENCVSVRFPDSYKLNELAVHMLPWQAEFSCLCTFGLGYETHSVVLQLTLWFVSGVKNKLSFLEASVLSVAVSTIEIR